MAVPAARTFARASDAFDALSDGDVALDAPALHARGPHRAARLARSLPAPRDLRQGASPGAQNICPFVRARVVYRERCGASLASRPRVAHVPRPFPTSQVRASYGDAQDGDSEQMHVPEDAFKNEMGHNISPERKAATALGNLFTMAATRVILDQFTGTRHRSPVYYKMVRAVRGPDVAPPPPTPRAPLAPDLEPRKNPVLPAAPLTFFSLATQVDFLSENPLRNGNEWLAKLMREPDNDLRITAMRIIETRRVFAESEFNWEVMNRVAKEEIDDDTLEMNKQMLMRSLGVSAEGSPSEMSGSAERQQSEANSSW